MHPALFCDELWAEELSFVDANFLENANFPISIGAKVRYRQPDQEATIESYSEGKLHITFKEPQRAVTLRQSIVFYQNCDGQRVCLGGGMIGKRGATYFERDLDLPEGLELNKSPN